jgi:hypothetical protein
MSDACIIPGQHVYCSPSTGLAHYQEEEEEKETVKENDIYIRVENTV